MKTLSLSLAVAALLTNTAASAALFDHTNDCDDSSALFAVCDTDGPSTEREASNLAFGEIDVHLLTPADTDLFEDKLDGKLDNPLIHYAHDILYGDHTVTVTTPSPVPLPAAVWLFGTGLIGLVGVARRKA